MLYTSYFSNIKKLPKDIIPISIAAKAPSWYNGYEYKVLAPSFSIFKEYKETLNEEQYVSRYSYEILRKLNPHYIARDLLKLSNNKSFALICYEKPDKFCHRHLVSFWLTFNGWACDEWRAPS